MCDTLTETTTKKDSSIEFGAKERELGVAVNRETKRGQTTSGKTDVHYNDTSGTVVIDIENDQDLFNFLKEIKDKLSSISNGNNPIDIAKAVAAEVLKKTPDLDTDGSFHIDRGIPLGVALQLPVDCSDRSLAIEGVLKSNGIEEAKQLVCIDRYPNGKSVNHADVIFTGENGSESVVITTGKRAGEVLSHEEYKTSYITERASNGLGQREIQKNLGHPYFQKI